MSNVQTIERPEAIIFDLSEVYLSGLKGTHERIGQHLRIPIDGSPFQGKDLTKLFDGKITEADYWLQTIANNGWGVTVSDLKRMVRENFTPVEGTEAIVRELKQKDYRLGLLSVHAKEWIEYCEQKFHYRELFDVVMYSFEHGVCKPEPRAFELILGELGVKPEQTVFIDDSEENIEAARDVGMFPIHFTTAQHLRGELTRLGIL